MIGFKDKEEEKKVLKLAMEILEEKLKANKDIKLAFQRTINALNQPPVLQIDDSRQKETYERYEKAKEVIQFIQQIITPFLNPNDKPSREQKIELWDNLQILKNLDAKLNTKYANVLLKLIEEHNPRSLPGLTSLERISNPYEHAVHSNEDRRKYHAREIDPSKDSSKFQGLKEEFQQLKGDYLKTKILEDFKNQIDKVASRAELKILKDTLLSSDEYAVLRTAQGLFTKITGRPTSSMKAFEIMFKAQEDILKKEEENSMNNQN